MSESLHHDLHDLEEEALFAFHFRMSRFISMDTRLTDGLVLVSRGIATALVSYPLHV